MLNIKDIEKINQVAEYYRSPECGRRLQNAAEKFGYTRTKIRKMLITTGDYETEQTKIINGMKNDGKTIQEISDMLGVSLATVSSSLPYNTLFYGTVEPSEHTAAVREYRAYEKKQKKLSALKQRDLKENKKNQEETFLETSRCRGDAMVKAPKPSRRKGEALLPKGLIRLNVRLECPYDEEDRAALHKYAGVKRGDTISRDIIVHEDMPLRSLHYVLQRAFGFRDWHLHSFEISKNRMISVTENSMKNLLNLSGVIFTDRPFNETHETLYADIEPRYEGGSFKSWLRHHYTDSWYNFGDWLDEFHSPDGEEDWPLVTHAFSGEKICRLTRVNPFEADPSNIFAPRNVYIVSEETISDLGGNISYVKVNGSVSLWNNSFEKCDPKDPDAYFIERLTLGDLDLYNGLIYSYDAPTNIIERLPIKNVLALSGDYLPYDAEWNHVHTVTGLKHPQIVSDAEIQSALARQREIMPKPFTDILTYRYDWGDNWRFYITGSRGCSDLVEQGVISESELKKAINKIEKTGRPVLLARDGDMLIEDVGNIKGFINFLEFLNISEKDIVEEHDLGSSEWVEYTVYGEDGEEDTEESMRNGFARTELLNWAVSQGWHRNDVSNINLL